MTDPIKYTTTIQVSSQQIADQIVTAIEGGSNYWCNRMDVETPDNVDGFDKPFYSDPKIYEDDFKFIFTPHEDPPAELTPEKIQRGLTYLAEKYPDHLSDMLTENGDAGTADVFLQACLFGEIVYG